MKAAICRILLPRHWNNIFLLPSRKSSTEFTGNFPGYYEVLPLDPGIQERIFEVSEFTDCNNRGRGLPSGLFLLWVILYLQINYTTKMGFNRSKYVYRRLENVLVEIESLYPENVWRIEGLSGRINKISDNLILSYWEEENQLTFAVMIPFPEGYKLEEVIALAILHEASRMNIPVLSIPPERVKKSNKNPYKKRFLKVVR